MPVEDIWALEKGFSLAWPALLQRQVGGWLLKAGGGVSRRSNSANPTLDSKPLRAVLPSIILFYREQSLPTRVRTLSVQAPDFEDELALMGFHHEGEARTLYARVLNGGDEPGTFVEEAPSQVWIDGVNSAQQRTQAEGIAFQGHVTRISLPCAFLSSLDADGVAVSWAYGALNGAQLIIESVVTRSDRRGQGHGKRTIQALVHWAKKRGATTGVLQVQANNFAACHLYSSQGFTEELYRYRYWQR